MFEFISTLFEAAASPRIPHPEDAIFDGGLDAKRYIKALKGVIADPGSVSIKWDGGIALIFGIAPDGQFFINDKYMPAGYYAHSPADWERYDTEIKKSKTARTDLYPALAKIWEGMRASQTKPGVFKGDLMWTGKLTPKNGQYIFRPTTVEYRIPVKSTLGTLVGGKDGGIVVHQYNGAPWDGVTGLVNNSNVAIISPTAGLKFSLNEPTQLVAGVTRAETQIPAAEKFLLGMDGVARAAIKTYFNKKITGQTNEELTAWIATNVSGAQARKLLGDDQDGYLYTNASGYEALRTVWNSVYHLKVNLADQLEHQVKGFEQWTGGQKAGEGFVVNTPEGLVKLVNRGVFGAAHFNK
jgi:hypothetical protein